MNRNEFDLFMAQALDAAGKINHLQSVKLDAMSKAGVYGYGDIYGDGVDADCMLKMAIAGTDDIYVEADNKINAIYAEIEKAGITPAVSDISNFQERYFSNETRLSTLHERQPVASQS